MLIRHTKLRCNKLSILRYYVKFVLIILFYILETIIATSETTTRTVNSNNVFINSSEIVHKYSETQNQIFKYRAQCENCTRVKRTVERILHRQKRFLVFPKGSAIVVTMAGVKALMFSTPRGYNYLAEVDFYYPLPDKIYRPHRRTTTTEPPPPPPPPTTMPPEMFEHHDTDFHDHLHTGWDHDHHGDIFMPSGGWKDDIFKNINAPMEANMMDVANSSRRYWDEDMTYRNTLNNFRPPSLQPKSRRRFDFITPTQPKSPVYYRGKRSEEQTDQGEEAEKVTESNEDWPHFSSYRERRDLYSQIESMFDSKGLQVRTCILRAICEAKHFLMPKGKSLFHDIFRILFTIPTKNEMNDDYSKAVRNHDDGENCWKLYENECPFSILELMLKSQKIL